MPHIGATHENPLPRLGRRRTIWHTSARSTHEVAIPMASKSIDNSGVSQTPASLYRADHQKDVVNRLRRIEGQVRGLVEMIQAGRSCEDVALQMSAARKAMDKAFYRMMACSVIEAISDAENDAEAIVEVERSTKLLEKFG